MNQVFLKDHILFCIIFYITHENYLQVVIFQNIVKSSRLNFVTLSMLIKMKLILYKDLGLKKHRDYTARIFWKAPGEFPGSDESKEAHLLHKKFTGNSSLLIL